LDATTAVFHRVSTDGTIIDLQKDGTTVGRIWAFSNSTSYCGASSGIYFNGANINPTTGDPTVRTDNANDIGQASQRFKDLYLGGGVYLGGTGSANKLDDYEEGTWTPSVTGPSWASTPWVTAAGKYIKIGRQVKVEFILFAKISGFPTLNTNGECRLAGLPFTHENDYADGRVWVNLVPVQRLGGVEDGVLNLELNNANTSGVIRKPNTGGVYQISLVGTDIQSDSRISGSFTYISS